jgi:uncharacterized membrane protein YphA (DoxX/SURF4 family)
VVDARRLGLALYSTMFLLGGWGQVQQPTGRADQARKLGLPVEDDLVRASGWAMIGAALALQIPPLRRPAALAIALQLLLVTPIGHRFWEFEPGQQRTGQQIHFAKNVSLLGAALYLAAKER